MRRQIGQLKNTELKISQEPYVFETLISGLLIIQRPVFGDDRGAFQEFYRKSVIEECLGRSVDVMQGQYSISKPGVLRGIHAEDQDKIVTPFSGYMLSVYLDMREDSDTFGKWIKVHFDNTADVPLTTVFIPNGVGNSLCVVGSDPVEYVYSVSKEYDPKTANMGVNPLDQELGINWGLSNPILSDRDKNLRSWSELF